jgi:hypothetical protein
MNVCIDCHPWHANIQHFALTQPLHKGAAYFRLDDFKSALPHWQTSQQEVSDTVIRFWLCYSIRCHSVLKVLSSLQMRDLQEFEQCIKRAVGDSRRYVIDGNYRTIG